MLFLSFYQIKEDKAMPFRAGLVFFSELSILYGCVGDAALGVPEQASGGTPRAASPTIFKNINIEYIKGKFG